MSWVLLAILTLVVGVLVRGAWRGIPVEMNELSWPASWLTEVRNVKVQVRFTLPWSLRSFCLRSYTRPGGEHGIEFYLANEGWRAAYFEKAKKFCERGGADYLLEPADARTGRVDVIRIDLGNEPHEVANRMGDLLQEVFESSHDSTVLVRLEKADANLSEALTDDLRSDGETSQRSEHWAEGRSPECLPLSFSVMETQSTAVQVTWVVAAVVVVFGVGFTYEVQRAIQRVLTLVWTNDVRTLAQWGVFLFGTYQLVKFALATYRPEEWINRFRKRTGEEVLKSAPHTGVRLLFTSLVFCAAGIWADFYALWWVFAVCLSLIGILLVLVAIGGRFEDSEPKIRVPSRSPEIVAMEMRRLALPTLVVIGTWIVSWRHLWL